MNLINLFISNLITNNLLLTKFFGLNTILEKENVLKISTTSTLLAIVISFTNYFLYTNLIFVFEFLFLIKTFIFILVLVIVFKIFELIIKNRNIYTIYDKSKVVIFISTLIMSVIFHTSIINFNIVGALSFLITSGIGYVIITYIFVSLSERFEQCDDIPKSFIGIPLSLVTLVIISLLFMRYM